MIKEGDLIIWYLDDRHAPHFNGLHVAPCIDCGEDWGVHSDYGPDLIPKNQAVKLPDKNIQWMSRLNQTQSLDSTVYF